MLRQRHFLIALGVLLTAPAVNGHPHAWIDITVTAEFDSDGRLTALHQVWLFDELYSVTSTQGMDRDGDGVPDQSSLDTLAEINLDGLYDYDYFTFIETPAGPVAIDDDARLISTRMVENQFEMTFALDVGEPAAPDPWITYTVYDPFYYISMQHADAAASISLDGAPDTCRWELIFPEPNPVATEQAAALDRGETGPPNLGAIFAERVTITCD